MSRVSNKTVLMILATACSSVLANQPTTQTSATRPSVDNANNKPGAFTYLWPKNVIRELQAEGDKPLALPEYVTPVERAYAELNAGRYRRALFMATALPQIFGVDARLIEAQARAQLGEVELALKSLDSIKGDPRSTLIRGKILIDGSRYNEAITFLENALAADATSVEVHFRLGQAWESLGDHKKALTYFAWFVTAPNDVVQKFKSQGGSGFQSAQDLTFAAAAVDRWATLSGAFAKRLDLNETILAMFVAAYDEVDREYWPAHLYAGQFLESRGNKPEALQEFTKAIARNPFDAALNLAIGHLELSRANESAVFDAVDRIRSVDVNSPVADLLELQLTTINRDLDRAKELANRLLQKRPTDLEVLSAAAALYSLRDDDAKVKSLIATAESIDPDNATIYSSIGIANARTFDADRVVKNLQIAIERAPWAPEPLQTLARAWLSDGDNEQARALLERAYEIDPFNIETVNYLRVLDEISKFKTFESERFIFRYDERDDPIVPLYIASYMDQAFDAMVAKYKFTPEQKPIVEVLPDAQSFSVRTAGIPGLETYGASLGRVMTVVAPRAGQTLGPFNWARVMRHEFTHTLNLMYTKGRVPRWLTEGLAVQEEDVPYRFAWVPESLYKRASVGEMMTPPQLARALRGGPDGEIAYMTGFWIARYIAEIEDHDAILRLLDAYRDGKSDDEAFKHAINMNVVEFYSKFNLWSQNQVQGWGYDDETKKVVKELEKSAQTLTENRQLEQAAELWEQVLLKQPMNATPHRRLAGIYLTLKRPADAAIHLKATLPLELADNRLAKRLSRIYLDANDLPNAMLYAKMSVQIDPYDPAAHELLGDLYSRNQQTSLAEQQNQVAALLKQRRDKSN